MNPDTLSFIIEEIKSQDINWAQIIIQSSILSVIFGIIAEIARRRFQKKLESLKNEFSIIQTTFSKNHSFVLDYFTNFYKHYRACQKVVNADGVEYPNKPTIDTEEIFLKNLDTYVTELNNIEPTIRLIFPEHLMNTHDSSIDAFNDFRKLIKSYYQQSNKPKDDLIFSFKQIDIIKNELEKGLRKYLRTEKIILE